MDAKGLGAGTGARKECAKERLTRLKKRVLRLRWVKWHRFALRNFSIPGNREVPLYDVAAYVLAGIFNGKLWRASKGLAYSFLMAVPPLLIFMFTLIAYLPVAGLQDELLTQLGEVIPEKIYEPISATIEDVMTHRHTSLLSIGFVLSIILAANAVHGMMMYFSDRNGEVRPFPVRYGVCVGIVFLLYTSVIVMLILLLGYRTALGVLFRQGVLLPGSLSHIAIAIGRWVIMIGVGLFTLMSIYYLIPARKSRVGFFSPGPVFALALFLVMSWGFRVYLVNFNRYNLLYGSIGTLLLILLWMLLNCMVLMLGYEINVAIHSGMINGKNARRHRLKVYTRKRERESGAGDAAEGKSTGMNTDKRQIR